MHVLSFEVQDNDVEENRSLLGVKLQSEGANYDVVKRVCGAASSLFFVVYVVVLLVVSILSKRTPNIQCYMLSSIGPDDGVFFVVGDWGRRGSDSQQTATSLMVSTARCILPQFIISTGDNFYPHGLEHAADPQILDTFKNVYSSHSLQVPWYAVLGNHDYGDTLTSQQLSNCSNPPPESLSECQPGCCYSPLWQVTAANLDSRWRLEQGVHKLQFPNLELDIFFMDTSPFIKHYREQPWANNIGGLSFQDAQLQQIILQSLLQNSSARRKIVVGHHPVKSYGEHCTAPGGSDCDDMSWLHPLLQEHKVLAYFSGHEHDLQYMVEGSPAVAYVVSGAGSDIRYGEFDGRDIPTNSTFVRDDTGFVAVVLRKDSMSLYYIVGSSNFPAYRVTLGV
ncbi:hypothetical protein CEUSTIGMA_g11165.t1 [Chlamydomonas eustigma]|uniref:Calcineurin-like phosphoesterase domain-containing protein n=1 Tax=Chlamydomonas eustigma TaxID=1157962 RepID=A0A250XLT0_9CHLO|nr:hypothetical protein CEUSTIGMA_g11165.t1 [Chlamydomonas eustigma]|eukprot:GAX83740.1 hypothetical protein CEUSTIGMA_g11165.t1 [Chlamydomonas eustigma]